MKSKPRREARCWNCRKKYPKERAWQKFCGAFCRREYNRNGSVPAWRIEKTVQRFVRAEIRELRLELVAQVDAVVRALRLRASERNAFRKIFKKKSTGA